jgi:hypothetical protein
MPVGVAVSSGESVGGAKARSGTSVSAAPSTSSTSNPPSSPSLGCLEADFLGTLTFWLGPGAWEGPELVTAAFKRLNGLTDSDHVSSRKRCTGPKAAWKVAKSDHLAVALSMAACAVAGWSPSAAPVSPASWCRPSLHLLNWSRKACHFRFNIATSKSILTLFPPSLAAHASDQRFICGQEPGQQRGPPRFLLALHHPVAIPPITLNSGKIS